MKKARKKKRSLKEREQALANAIETAFDDIKSRAHYKHLADDLVGQAMAILSIAEDKAEGIEPTIMWSDDPLAALYATVAAYAEHTKIPIDNLVNDMIMRIGPAVEAEFRWN